jgi:hypothetical protein
MEREAFVVASESYPQSLDVVACGEVTGGAVKPH